MSQTAQHQHGHRSMAWARVFSGAALTAMGVLVAHWVGYLSSYRTQAARVEALADHGHIELVGPGVFAVGTVVAVLLASRCIRAVRDLRPTWTRLAIWQMCSFAALEAVERLNSLSDLVHEPGVVLGLLLQIPVAWLLVAAIRLGAAVMERAALVGVAAATNLLSKSRIAPALEPQSVVFSTPLSPISSRGPPVCLD